MVDGKITSITGRAHTFIPVGRALHGTFARETALRRGLADAGMDLTGNGKGWIEEPRIAVPRK